MKTNLTLRPRIVALISGILLWGVVPSYGLLISDDVDFTTIYQATVFPNSANPAWAQAGSSGTATIAGGVLTLEATLSGSRIYSQTFNDGLGPWDGSTDTGSTIEFSLRVDEVEEGAVAATSIYFSTGTLYYLFQFHTTNIRYGSDTVAFDTTDDFHRYRITLSSEGAASLYIDNNVMPLITDYMGGTMSNPTNRIYFGDPGASVGGKAQWEYLAYTNAEATAPIPEGSTAGLLMGAVVLTVIGCRIRKIG